MDVICYGQQNWDVCWTAKQQFMTRLARRGHRVLYVDPHPTPAGPGAGERLGSVLPQFSGMGLRRIDKGLWVFNFPESPLGEWFNARRKPLVLAGILRRLRMARPIALVLTPGQRWLSQNVPAAGHVYYAVDEYTGFGGLEERHRAQIRDDEERLLRGSDVALAVSPRLQQRFAQLQPRSYLLPNAADVDHFAPSRLNAAPPHPQVAPLPRPRIGYVGQVDDRMDQPLIAEAARARPQWQFVLVGRIKSGVDVSALRALPNVHLLEYQPYQQLPGILREIDVCVAPYVSSPLTESCCPLKIYEYLATGRPVVSRPVSGLGVCRDAVTLASTPTEFIEGVEQALREPDQGRDRRLQLAQANTWDQRTDELERYLNEALRVGSSRGDGPTGLIRPRVAKLRGADLDAKDDSERQLHQDFHGQRPPASKRLFIGAVRLAGRGYYLLRVLGRVLSGRRPIRVRKVLVVRHGLLGDTIALLPMLAALRKHYAGARIVLGAQPNMKAAELLELSGAVDELVTLDFFSRPTRLQRLRDWWKLFAEGYDLVLNGVSYFLIREAFYCGAPRMYGLYDGHPLQELNDRVLPLDPNRHEADNNLDLSAALGAAVAPADYAPVLAIDPAALEPASAELARRLQLPPDAPLLLMHPGGNRASRRWPTERFAELAGRMLQERPDLHVVLTGTPSEDPLVARILAEIKGPERTRIGRSGPTDLKSLVALLDRAAVVVSNDTGVMHVARARKRPLVALLGPENDRRWGPHPSAVAPAIALRTIVPCAPCVREDCEGHYCMYELSVDRVADAVRRLLDQTVPADGLEQGTTRRSWRDLAERGHDLPLVSVLLLPDPDLSGPPLAEAVAAAAKMVREQNYPNVELVLCTSQTDVPAEPVHQVVRVSSARPTAFRRAALASVRGQFLCELRLGERWEPDRLSRNVARLVRSPHAAATVREQLFREHRLAEIEPELSAAMVRTQSLRLWWSVEPAPPAPGQTPTRPEAQLIA